MWIAVTFRPGVILLYTVARWLRRLGYSDSAIVVRVVLTNCTISNATSYFFIQGGGCYNNWEYYNNLKLVVLYRKCQVGTAISGVALQAPIAVFVEAL